jgi:hypothetical protein
VELLEGFGRVVDPHTVEVNGKAYSTKNILIAVGGTPHRLPIPGAELTITSDEALELPSRPNKITGARAAAGALQAAPAPAVCCAVWGGPMHAPGAPLPHPTPTPTAAHARRVS